MNSPSIRVIALSCFLLPSLLGAFPARSWRHLDNGRFILSYEKGFEPQATNALRIAEEVRGALAPLYGRAAVERRIAIAMADDSDDPNGGAFFDLPLIVISPRKGEMLWRGETHWLRTVISHELAHLYSFRSLVPPIRIALSGGYRGESAPVTASAEASIDPRAIPVWLAEAFSQLGSFEFKADFRDPYREALLRDAWHGRRLLTLAEMGRFEGTSREYELAYNQGFDLILYVKRRFRVETWETLLRETGKRGIDGGLRKCFGIGLAQLDADWRKDLEARWGASRGDESLQSAFAGEAFIQAHRRDVLGMAELESLPHRRGIVANWRHDALRYDLYLPGLLQPVPDVGPQVRQNPRTGEVFYTRRILDRAGRESDDLFSLDTAMREKRWTTNARVTAFDAATGGLLFAYCVGGRTTLRFRASGAALWKTLASLPGDLGVYGLALGPSNESYAIIGDGKSIRAYRVDEDGYLSKLWPEHRGDLRDLRLNASGRCLFVSTEDGTPQAYLAESTEGADWRRISDARSAVRYPAFDGAERAAHVVYSQFSAGKWVRVSAKLPEQTPIENPSAAEMAVFPELKPSGSTRPARVSGGPLLPTVPFFSLGFSQSDSFGPGGSPITSRSLSLGASTSIVNSGLDTGFSIWGSALFPLPYAGPAPGWRAGSRLEFPVGVARMAVQYEVNADNRLSPNSGVSEHYSSYAHQVDWQAVIQSSRHLSFFLEALGAWADYSSTIATPGYTYRSTGTASLSLPGIYQLIGGAIGFLYQRVTHQKMGVTGLSSPGVLYRFRMEEAWLTFNPRYWSSSYLIDENQRFTFDFLSVFSLPIQSRAWAMDFETEFKSMSTRISSTANARVPLGYFSIGGEKTLSGFPSGIVPAASLLRLSYEARWNPFFDAQNGFRWWDRLGVGAKIEAGLATVPGYKISLLLASAEFALRFKFYAKPSQRSAAYVKVGLPLTLGYPGMPGYQIYAGLDL